MRSQPTILLLGLVLGSGCRHGESSDPPPADGGGHGDVEENYSGAEQPPPLPKYPDPPVLANGCPHLPPSSEDDPRGLALEFLHASHQRRRERPVIVVVDNPLRLRLRCREAIELTSPTSVELCLQRPDGSVLRKQLPYANAETRCVGCDPYPGAPANVCANACQAELREPELELFDAAAMALEGSYLLAVEFPDGSCTGTSFVFDAIPPELSY